MSWGTSDKEVVKARNDLMNWMRSSNKFDDAELNKIECKIADIEQASYSYGYDEAELEAESGEGF